MTDKFKRFHPLRETKEIRVKNQETRLKKSEFIMPIFIHEGLLLSKPINSLPGIRQQSLGTLDDEILEVKEAGLDKVILFGIPKSKDALGSEAANPNGIIQKAIRQIKKNFPEMTVIADLCLCEYTNHGHCGLIKNDKIDNDATLESLKKIALTYEEAGADIVAPSGMMDGVTFALKSVLNSKTKVWPYSVKYCSHFYGPFREAAGSDFTGSREAYQMAFTQREEAEREAKADIEEGADALIVKPAGPYLDIIRDIKNQVKLPVIAYQVSGEYAMLKSVKNDEAIFYESLVGIKRAGADFIVSYYSKEIARTL